jgi:hypothetical protein
MCAGAREDNPIGAESQGAFKQGRDPYDIVFHRYSEMAIDDCSVARVSGGSFMLALWLSVASLKTVARGSRPTIQVSYLHPVV